MPLIQTGFSKSVLQEITKEFLVDTLAQSEIINGQVQGDLIITGNLDVYGSSNLNVSVNADDVVETTDKKFLTTSDQTITGVKSFSSAPLFPALNKITLNDLRLDLTGNNTREDNASIRSYSGADPLSTLVGGTTQGTVIESTYGRHIGIAVRGNDTGDSFFVSTGLTAVGQTLTNYAPTYIPFKIKANNDITLGKDSSILFTDSSKILSIESGAILDIKTGATFRLLNGVSYMGSATTLLSPTIQYYYTNVGNGVLGGNIELHSQRYYGSDGGTKLGCEVRISTATGWSNVGTYQNKAPSKYEIFLESPTNTVLVGRDTSNGGTGLINSLSSRSGPRFVLSGGNLLDDAIESDFCEIRTLLTNITEHNGSTRGLQLAGTLVTSTATELNLLKGKTESNFLTNTSQQIFGNKVFNNDCSFMTPTLFIDEVSIGSNRLKYGGQLITATAAEINLLSGLTSLAPSGGLPTNGVVVSPSTVTHNVLNTTKLVIVNNMSVTSMIYLPSISLIQPGHTLEISYVNINQNEIHAISPKNGEGSKLKHYTQISNGSMDGYALPSNITNAFYQLTYLGVISSVPTWVMTGNEDGEVVNMSVSLGVGVPYDINTSVKKIIWNSTGDSPQTFRLPSPDTIKIGFEVDISFLNIFSSRLPTLSVMDTGTTRIKNMMFVDPFLQTSYTPSYGTLVNTISVEMTVKYVGLLDGFKTWVLTGREEKNKLINTISTAQSITASTGGLADLNMTNHTSGAVTFNLDLLSQEFDGRRFIFKSLTTLDLRLTPVSPTKIDGSTTTLTLGTTNVYCELMYQHAENRYLVISKT